MHKWRIILWLFIALITFGVGTLALINYFYVPPPIIRDANGYKTVRVYISPTAPYYNRRYGYGRPLIQKLLENTLTHLSQISGEKIKIQYVERQAHIAIFVLDAPKDHKGNFVSRFEYKYTHPFSQKIAFQAMEVVTCESQLKSLKSFSDYALSPETSLAVGTQYSHYDPRYAYLSYYMIALGLLNEYPTRSHIEKVLKEFSDARDINLNSGRRSNFCALIAIHEDNFGLRKSSFLACSTIGKVHAMGSLFHNDDTLWLNNCDRFWDDWRTRKIRALLKFQFNLCIENTNCAGYISEKLLDALLAGCIPIYAGCENRPHPKVFNQNAMLFWSYDGCNADTLEKISHLYHHPEAYRNFLSQPIFMPTAAEYINQVLTNLHNQLCSVILATLFQYSDANNQKDPVPANVLSRSGVQGIDE